MVNKPLYCLIVNKTTGTLNWYLRADKFTDNLDTIEQKAVDRFKVIYINRLGGWMTECCVADIVDMQVDGKWPNDP